jgi:hypothetical protein
MPWYVELEEPLGSDAIKAVVVEYPNDAAFTKATNVQNPVPYSTKAAAQAQADKYNGQPASKKNKTTPPNINVGTTTGVGFNGSGVLSGLDAIGAFFSSLGQANTWIRVGEALLGLILISVGVAHMTHAVSVATKIAKTAGMAVAL